jgi:hypothetical protein
MTRGLFHRSAAVLAVSLPASVLAAEWPTMEREEISRSIIANTLVGSVAGSPYAEYYAPDGVIRGESKDGRYRAAWWLRDDDTMCFKYGEAVDGYWPGGCVRLSLDGDTVTFIRLDGSVENPAKLLSGNPKGL